MFQRTGPKALKYDLNNITSLMEHLGNPHDSLTCIHIAGTNGKGSVSHMLASILQESGLTVGLYTSPHYRDYRERIRLDGELITKRYVIQFVNRIKEHPEINKLKPTFFEIGVAMAFCYFADTKPDICIIETGLGGRLDSTNVITPILSLITNIGYDHQATLGETLPEIASEKAGIIKPHVPVLIGEYQEEVKQVFADKAQKESSTLYQGKDLISKQELLSVKNIKAIHRSLSIPYLTKNFDTALATITILNKLGYSIDSQHITLGIKHLRDNTGYMGRWQQLSDHPTVIADAAHNQEGITILADHLKTLTFDRLHIILGMVGDKPLDKVLSLLPTDAKYYFAKADIPRGKPAIDLQSECIKYDLKGKSYSSVKKALASAKLSARENDLIIVTGSIFTVAEVV